MKRILAREFLLLVGCLVAVLLVGLWGWGYNASLRHRLKDVESRQSTHRHLVDSLNAQNRPTVTSLVELFDDGYVQANRTGFLQPLPWYHGSAPYDMDDLLSGFSRVYLSRLADILAREGYLDSAALVRYSRTIETRRNETQKRLRESDTGNNPRDWKPPLGATRVVNAPDGSELLLPSFMGGSDVDDLISILYSNAQPSLGTVGRSSLGPSNVGRPGLLNALALSRGESPADIVYRAFSTRVDSLASLRALLFTKVVMHESESHRELRAAHKYFLERNAIICTFDELLCSVQRKPAPPSRVLLSALQRETQVVADLQAKEASILGSILTEQDQWSCLKWAMAVLFVLVYPLRLLVLGTRWALQTLRS